MAKIKACLVKLSFITVTFAAFPPFLSNSFADCENDFSYKYVSDFKYPSYYHRVSPEKQKMLADRRRGVYAVELRDMDSWFTLPGGFPKRLLVDVTTEGTARMCFEDYDGQIVSCRELLNGKLSDESIYWGDTGHGVSARYGIIRDVMPMLISPHKRQITLVLKRQDKCAELQNVRLLPTIWQLCSINDEAEDIFSRVCEEDDDAVTARACAKSGTCPVPCKMVACYVTGMGCHDADKKECTVDLRPRYIVLKNNGGFYRIVGNKDDAFSNEFYLLFEWWREFNSAVHCDDTDIFYAVRRDSIARVLIPFSLSRCLDQMIITPEYFKQIHGKGMPSQDKLVGDKIDVLLREPGKMFSKTEYVRIQNTPQNKELRHRLDAATDPGKR
ncbi:MAG: hypothetical protein IJU44_06940 [Kiritimatiellae bacterium]|nr:hypothetical protein [Kiritimatiellia bacterium]